MLWGYFDVKSICKKLLQEVAGSDFVKQIYSLAEIFRNLVINIS